MKLDWHDPLSFKLHAVIVRLEQHTYARMREYRKERELLMAVARAKVDSLRDPPHALQFRFADGRVVTKAWSSFTGYLADKWPS